MLTRKQNELLLFINKRLKEGGVSPSFDEMKEALRLKSKSGIHRLITGLEERGFLRRLPHRARALEVLKLPEAAAMPAPNVTPLARTCARHGRAREGSCPRSWAASGCRWPAPPGGQRGAALSCRSMAGSPPARRSRRCATIPRLDVPDSLLGSGEHYCLEVQGDSMVEAGIQDGDIAIIRRADSAETGEIVVALMDEARPRSSACARRAPRSRWSPPTPTTRRASSAPTGSRSRAAWWDYRRYH